MLLPHARRLRGHLFLLSRRRRAARRRDVHSSLTGTSNRSRTFRHPTIKFEDPLSSTHTSSSQSFGFRANSRLLTIYSFLTFPHRSPRARDKRATISPHFSTKPSSYLDVPRRNVRRALPSFGGPSPLPWDPRPSFFKLCSFASFTSSFASFLRVSFPSLAGILPSSFYSYHISQSA